MLPIQHVLLIRCMYPESVPARHGRVTALAAGKVHQVDLAGDAVLVLLALHQLRLGKIKVENDKWKLPNCHNKFTANVIYLEKRKKKRANLCLGHDESEHGVRSGALIIHPSSSCGTLLVAKVQPALQKKNTVSICFIAHGINM